MESGKYVFDNPFEIVRNQWNLRTDQSNQYRNGEMSKGVPAMFEITKKDNKEIFAAYKLK